MKQAAHDPGNPAAPDPMLKRILLSEPFILAVILLNAVVIFIQGFAYDRSWTPTLDLLDNLFTAVFLLEALVKVRTWGMRNYLASSWNVFDGVLVLLALPSLIIWLFPVEFLGLEFLLVFRIMRVFKFFRFIRFVPRMDHIIAGVGRAAKASVLILFAFFVFNFIVSLISCFMFRDLAPEYFRDPLIAWYSIFKVFTVEGWYEIPDAIAEEASPTVAFFTRLYFIVILFFGGIFGLSLVNSIFVDTMVSDNNDELERRVAELQEKIDLLLERSR
jgi:voltage-gated sodium channel